jgi:hypothetical protein
MKYIHARRGAMMSAILLGIMLGGCGLLSPSKPVAIIVAPPSGTQIDVYTEVQVQVNSTDDQGIVRIDLLANGTVVATETSPQAAGQPTFSAVLRWTPKTSGAQVVEARAYNRKGDASAPVSVNIQVRDVQALATATPVAFPTLTPLPTSPTPPTPTILAPAPVAPTDAPPAAPPPQVIVVQPPPQQQPTQPAAPSKPNNFVATGAGTTIAFTWEDKSTNELGFRIYQVGTVAPVISLPQNTGTGGMSYNWTGQACNFTASFYIRAYNDSGESSSSNSDGAVTVPCVPASLTGTGSGTTINFNWSVPSVHNESGFRIYQQGVAAPVGTRGPNLGSGGTNFALNGSCNLTGTYSVRAYNSAGESADSNKIQAETIPCGPTGFSITSVNKTTVNYKWTDNSTNETGFRIYRNDALYAPLPAHAGTGTVANDAFQNCGQTLVYSVRAFNNAGESNSSEHVGATTQPFLSGCP